MDKKSFIEVQFPIAPLSLESYKERVAGASKTLSSLGKWWGSKPLVLTRAIILGAVFPASPDPNRWPVDLDIFLKCMCLDNDGMWKRKIKALPANLCFPYASLKDREELFEDENHWRRGANRMQKKEFEKKVFYQLGHTSQREYCCRVEEVDGPTKESWLEINAYLNTSALSLPELVQQLSQQIFGKCLKVGDAFSGLGSIPFEAAQLGCDVYASDLNPVASLLTWGALNIIGGSEEFQEKVHAEQNLVYDQLDAWIQDNCFEFSEEGWRADTYLYCLEIKVPEWKGWRIPISPSWVIETNSKTWIELVPIEEEKRFGFQVHIGGAGYEHANKGTKQGMDIVLPQPLRELFKREGQLQQMPRNIPYNQLIQNAGGLRQWEKSDFKPLPGDVLQERLYCIRWRKPGWVDERGCERRGKRVYREPLNYDLNTEQRVVDKLTDVFDEWQKKGWIPNWRIGPGEETPRLMRTRGWTYWHHLFTPRQLLMAGFYSQNIAKCEDGVRAALLINLGRLVNHNARLCYWQKDRDNAVPVFTNQALNPYPNYAGRALLGLFTQLNAKHGSNSCIGDKSIDLSDARIIEDECLLWVTDPPYADAVNYEELSEFFLAWYATHLKAVFPDWYTDSMRAKAIKGMDAPFRIAMADCYRRLAEKMPNNGLQVLMFTHKSTDVWEDLSLIMWSAGLQVKQVWSVTTETAGVGIRAGNYVQATYNMVLRKRYGDKTGFTDFITPQVNKRVKEVVTRMRESQIEGGLVQCGYTDTDYLLAAQAVAVEVVTGYASIDGIDLDAELRTPNAERGRSALRSLMENAKRTATNFLVPPSMHRALKKVSSVNAYQFWREFSAKEKFILKGLEQESDGIFKVGCFQDLGRAYGIPDYESLMGPTRANHSRTKIPKELPSVQAIRFEEVPVADRSRWSYSPTRHVYHALKLLEGGADVERAVKHLVDSTDFWNIRTTRLSVILAYLNEITANLPHWESYKDLLISLEIGVEHRRA